MASGAVHKPFKDIQFSCMLLWFSLTQLRFFQTVQSRNAMSNCYFYLVNVRLLGFTHHMYTTKGHVRTDCSDLECMTTPNTRYQTNLHQKQGEGFNLMLWGF